MILTSPPASAKRVEDICELTQTQQGLLFESLYDPGSAVYLEQVICVLHADLDASHLRAAFEQVVARHGVLRSLFYWVGMRKPMQVTLRDVELPWHEDDWRGLSATAQRHRFDAFIHTDRSLGLKLDVAPVMRCALLRLSPRSYRLVWTFHHLLLDGWSLPIFFKDLFHIYDRLAAQQSTNLPDPPAYREYVLWRQRYNDPDARAFWTKYLSGFSLPPGIISAYRSLPRTSTFAIHCEAVRTISPDLYEQLREFARGQRITLHVVVSAAVAWILSRWSGSTDVLFGCTVSGRPADLPHCGDMVGLFINTVPRRVRITMASTLNEWLQHLQSEHLDADRHSFAALADVQSWSELPGGTNLFELLLAFENYPSPEEWGGEKTRVIAMRAFEQTGYPLALTVTPGRAFRMTLAWKAGVFDGTRAQRLLDNLVETMDAMVARPNARLWELPMVSVADEGRLLDEWSSGALVGTDSVCLHERIAAVACAHPDRTAVVCDDDTLTYAELENRANGLAWRLQRLGVGPDVCVGIAIERSTALLVAVLGVLKAGGAYLPMDIAYPRERLRWMAGEAVVKIVLCSGSEVDWMASHGIRLERLDAEETASHAPPVRVHPDHLAYIIYTSGSTGKPKGVMLSRGAVDNMLSWYVQSLSTTPSPTRVLVISSFSFDLTQKALLAPLVMGGSVYLSSAPFFDPRAILEQIASAEITLLNCTPSALYPLLDAARPDEFRALRTLRHTVLGGEPVVRMRVMDWLNSDKVPHKLMNSYGPTECADLCTSEWIDGQSVEDAIAMGRPVWNTRLYVLDRSLALVPVGTPGELYIGGVGLARGYVRRPALTAERFVPNPFTNAPGERIYRTGDIVRYLPDGRLEFLGRRDHQVKLRGHRIELAEIEAVLRMHAGVRDAVVQLEPAALHPRLLAYITATVPGAGPTSDEMRRHTRDWLPEVMIPSLWTTLDVLPLTPNGKIDRAALPRPTEVQAQPTATQLDPFHAQLERDIATLWQEVLQIPHVNPHDNFFDLGGNSLTAISIFSRLYTMFGVDLPLKLLFAAPTVRQLALDITPRISDPRPGNFVQPVPRRLKSRVAGRPEMHRATAAEEFHRA